MPEEDGASLMNKQELTELGLSSWDRLRLAVEKGDKKQALLLMENMHKNTIQIYGHLTDTIDLLLSTLAHNEGEEEIYKIQRANSLRVVIPSPAMKDFAGLNADDKLKKRVGHWTELHGVPADIEEDSEKYIIRVNCNTGSDLVNRGNYGKTKRPYTWSASQKGISYYCVHCTISFELLWTEQYGYPLWITFPPQKPGDKCTQYIFKDTKSIPEEYYRRLGLEKPANLR